jgi:hypothetical protein
VACEMPGSRYRFLVVANESPNVERMTRSECNIVNAVRIMRSEARRDAAPPRTPGQGCGPGRGERGKAATQRRAPAPGPRGGVWWPHLATRIPPA